MDISLIFSKYLHFIKLVFIIFYISFKNQVKSCK
jgi:hypothetical protein